jgi:hypothetical protein
MDSKTFALNLVKNHEFSFRLNINMKVIKLVKEKQVFPFRHFQL